MLCDICGSEGALIRQITRTYGKNEDLLVIENIPVVSCSHCGESYLTAATLHEIERISVRIVYRVGTVGGVVRISDYWALP